MNKLRLVNTMEKIVWVGMAYTQWEIKFFSKKINS